MISESNQFPLDYEFVGTFERSIDAQRRITLPPLILSEIKGRYLYIVPSEKHGFIHCLPENLYGLHNKLNDNVPYFEELMKITDKNNIAKCHKCPFSPDKRVTLPLHIYKHLEEPVRVNVIGMGVYFDIMGIHSSH